MCNNSLVCCSQKTHLKHKPEAQLGVILPPKECLRVSGDFLGCYNLRGGKYCWHPVAWDAAKLHCTGQPPTAKSDLAQMSVVPRLKNSDTSKQNV